MKKMAWSKNRFVPVPRPRAADSQTGTTLVEMMIAMLIGTLVILAAGSLFEQASRTAARVAVMTERQAVISYALDVVTGALRRGEADPDAFVLRPSEGGDDCTLHDVGSGEPLVDGLACDDEPVVIEEAAGTYRVRLRLSGETTALVLYAVDRHTALMTEEGTP